MISVDIRSDVARLTRNLEAFEREAIPKALSRSLNRTAEQARTQASREIRTHYYVSARAISRAIKIIRAREREPTAAVEGTGPPLPLVAFGARPTKRGVSVAVKRGHRKLIRGAFIARMKSGHLGVFGRGEYVGGKFIPRLKRLRRGGNDLPITELKTIGVPVAMRSRAVLRAVEAKIRQVFPSILERELRFYISRLGPSSTL